MGWVPPGRSRGHYDEPAPEGWQPEPRRRRVSACARSRRGVAAIERIAADPSAPNNNIRPLRGVRNGFRVRVGDWRVSYTLDRSDDVLTVVEVARRGGAYR